MLVIIFQMVFLFLPYVSGDIFRYVAHIDRAVDILLQQDGFCAGKVFYMEAVFQGLVSCFDPPTQVIYFTKAFGWESFPRKVGGEDLVSFLSFLSPSSQTRTMRSLKLSRLITNASSTVPR